MQKLFLGKKFERMANNTTDWTESEFSEKVERFLKFMFESLSKLP